jgi:cytochrome P450
MAAGPPARPPQAEWKGIADEALRYASPVDLLTRVALEELEVGGCRIGRGEALIFSLLCANHDPAQFGEFAGMVTAKSNSSDAIPFGAGAHLCVGNRLSRIVVAEAFSALAELPAMRAAGEVKYGPGRVVRTIASLPVEFQ